MVLHCCRFESIKLGSEPDRDDLHRFGSTTGTPATATPELLDVVAHFGLIGPFLNLFLAHHTHIV